MFAARALARLGAIASRASAGATATTSASTAARAIEDGAAPSAIASLTRALRTIKSFAPGATIGKLKPEPRGMEAPMTSFEAGARQEGWGSAGGGAAPWTPTRELKKRKSYFKRCGHMMETLERERMKELAAERVIVPFRPGDVVKLTLEVPENMRKTQTFTGICIAKRHRGMGSSFTLRSAVGNLVVERTFPLFTPNIKGMEILERRKVRRAKLYYLRDKPLRYSRP
ncbi:Ribosomal protein L19 [Ostreococcus tauri]|uniref:Ribosomal protein L19 n=2 Tax=Ostreococcus tauri TaxID=70448 RepID=A0A096PAT9_OSTTA|nr:Ribosomal protein L19 [Ostreococcus tauri]CEG02110.1 Ribosomal protein L19 [Ostreococcus tauri]|eukprot:XP_003083022.2 Ribosomal protein L19 [Ostreococcus tauri]